MTREERNKEIQEELKRKEEQKETLKKVGKVTKIVLIIVLIISSFILYARFVSTSFLVVREYKVTSPNLPTNFTGFKIVQFSDLYYGSTIDTEDLQDIVDKINELKPDLVVFTGDLIAPNYTLEDGEQENITNLLKSITSTVGKYAVNGNNDIQNEVFEMAKRSILLNNLENKFEIINDDIINLKNYFSKNTFDVIVTNPPYKKNNTGIINEDKRKFISRHETKATLEDFIKVSKDMLKDKGEMYIVHRPERLVDLLTLMRKYKIEPKKIRFVYSNVNSVSKLVLIKGVKNARPFLKLEKNLYIYT